MSLYKDKALTQVIRICRITQYKKLWQKGAQASEGSPAHSSWDFRKDPPQTAKLSTACFHSLAAESSASVTGDELTVPEQQGFGEVTCEDLCPTHRCQSPRHPSAPFLAIVGRAIVQKLLCIFLILTKVFLSYACICLRVSTGKKTAG